MKKGISLIALITVVVVTIIITTTVTITGVNAMNNAKKTKFALEMSYVQEAVYKYKWDNGSYPITQETINLDLTQVNVNSVDQFDEEPVVDTNTIELYEIDFSLLGNVEKMYGNKQESDDMYVVSKNTDKVYYIQGESIGSNVYYTLNNELMELIDYSDGTNTVSNKDGITISKSTDTWTNEIIETRVYVPQSYTNITVSTNVNGTISNISGTNGNYVIDNISGNYSVIITYTKDSASQTQIENISNYDATIPTIEISEIQKMSTVDTGTEYSYVKINKKSDDLSGIKFVKYTNSNIEDANCKSYFSSSGIIVKDDMITVEDGVSEITVYIEDNAGNYSVQRITI